MRHLIYLFGGLFLTAFAIVHSAPSGPTQLYNDPVFLDAEIRRIRAGKAGDPRPPVVFKRVNNIRKQVVEDGNATSSEEGSEGSDDEDYYEDSVEIEVTCAPGKGWHWRGQRCVLYNCPGGSSERDFNTGRCLHSFQPKGKHKPNYSQWNSLNHVYSTHPAQRSISRGLLSLLRRG